MLTVKNLVKIYHTKGGVVTKALDNVSVDFPETGMVFLLGKSGSGKSTLLNMIGGLDRPDSGEVIVKGKSSKNFSTRDFDSYRNTFIGFIFQEYNILNEFNVEQNIALALQLQGKKSNKEAIAKLLKEVDLVGLEKRKPNTLSGGQKQRIAIARALIKEPQIIMADEPTGALDSNTGKQVFDTLKKLSKQKLVIVVSHDREFAQLYGDRIIELKDGKIISDDSKVYQQAKKVSENVNLISGNIIQIKNASKLSAKDDKAIIDALKKQKGEVIISGGNNNLPNIKKALKINESGASESFDKTTKVDIKQYDGNQTKFIKSKMPFWRAFKIGASGLKVKPFRLVMTILLSTASFAMFGIVSTLMLYNPNYSIREAMRNVDYKTETINKKYKYKSQSLVIDYDTGKTEIRYTSNEQTNSALFGIKELKELNNNSSGLKFAGMFNFSSSYSGGGNGFYIEGLSETGEDKDYYNQALFTGFSDCGDDYMRSQGFNNCYGGTYPVEANEIAISNYMADALIQGVYFGKDTPGQEKDLVGKTISISGNTSTGNAIKEDLVITGVYHIADIPSTYDSLKKERESAVQSEENRKKVKEGLENFLNGGFFKTAFVSDKFYEAHKTFAPSTDLQTYVNSVPLKGIIFRGQYPLNDEVNYDWGESAYDYDYVKDSSVFKYYKIENDEPVDIADIHGLSDDEAIVSQYAINDLTRSAIGKFGSTRAQFEDMYNYLSSIKQFCEDDMTDAITKVYNDHYENFTNQLGDWQKSIFDEQFYNDYEAIKDCLNNYYNKFQFIRFFYYYGSQIYYTIENEEKYPSAKSSAEWTNAKDSFKKFTYDNEGKITDDDITKMDAFVKAFIDKIDEIRAPLFKHIGDKVCQAGGVQFSHEIYGKGDNIGYQELVNNLIGDNNITEEFITETERLYKKFYGKTLNLHDERSYYPDNHAVFDPCYEFKSYYFCKTGNSESDIKELNAKYYYQNSERYNSAPILSHNTIKTHIADKNVWINNIVTDYEAPSDAKYNNLMTVSDYSDNQIDAMIKDYGNYLYEMNNATYQQMTIMIQLVNQFKQIFLYVGIGTGVLAALLFANFISASISNKKKDIGILRAVGAKSTDVFKVFWSESGVIALICFVLATISSAITCVSLNNVIAGTLISIKILNFSIVNILIILGAAILISLLATLIPVIRAAKKPPVEAIRAL
ncbi:MAG: ATP-binding cassette domain-containing protein [Bacilli bacterium]|nr:ATP-binding cassette domain-containing protein [Bacilli bacterium]